MREPGRGVLSAALWLWPDPGALVCMKSRPSHLEGQDRASQGRRQFSSKGCSCERATLMRWGAACRQERGPGGHRAQHAFPLLAPLPDRTRRLGSGLGLPGLTGALRLKSSHLPACPSLSLGTAMVTSQAPLHSAPPAARGILGCSKPPRGWPPRFWARLCPAFPCPAVRLCSVPSPSGTGPPAVSQGSFTLSARDLCTGWSLCPEHPVHRANPSFPQMAQRSPPREATLPILFTTSHMSQLFSNMVHDSLIVFISPHHTYRMPAPQGRGCRSVSLLCPAGPGVPGRKQLLISPPQPFVLSEGGAHSSQGGDGQGLLGSFLERPLAFRQMDTPDVRPPPTSPRPALMLLCLWALGPGRPFIW